jgi:hypothetical protein
MIVHECMLRSVDMNRRRLVATLSVAALIFGAGCRPLEDIGRVSGRVTWEGEAVANATVTFQPSRGIASYGITDDDGRYKLKQAGGEEGAVLGKHAISIETYRIFADEAGEAREHPETIPPRYNADSVLSHDVQPGEQTVDFTLPLP